MSSKWSHLKSAAIDLRKEGTSLREVETILGIPRSTLSGWFKNVELTHRQQRALDTKYAQALVTARIKASAWHRAQKILRDRAAETSALNLIQSIDLKDKKYLEVALAFLYLGEGAKGKHGLSLGNSNPDVINFFIKAAEILYGIPRKNMRCSLHLRADQDPDKEIDYWARELGLSKINFTKPFVDARTVGRPTYETYHGVCAVRCANVATQRKLMYIASEFCKKIGE